MRGLPTFCILLSLGAHATAWWLLAPALGNGGDAGSAGAVLVIATELVQSTTAETRDAEPAAAPQAPAAPVVPDTPDTPDTPDADAARPDEVAAWRESTPQEAAPQEPVTAQPISTETGPTPTPAPRDEPAATTAEVAAESTHEATHEARPDPAPAPAAESHPTPAPATAATATPISAPSPAPATTRWAPSSPPPGLRLPSSVARGTAAADLVIDPRDPSFLDRARALGMRFILFQDGALTFFLELGGDDLRSAVRRTSVDTQVFSRRARDLAGVRAFDRLRDDVAERYGLDPRRCRLAALVPVAVDRSFRAVETAALAELERPADQIQALCGALTGDTGRPLRISHALLADGRWLELRP